MLPLYIEPPSYMYIIFKKQLDVNLLLECLYKAYFSLIHTDLRQSLKCEVVRVYVHYTNFQSTTCLACN